MSEIELVAKELIEYQGPDRVVHFTDFLLNKADSGSRVHKFNCGFSLFNERLGGIETGEVVVISGQTKNGKTLFAEGWLKSMMTFDSKAKAAVFSFEVQTEKLLLKYMKDEHLPLHVPMSLQTMDFEWLKKRCLESKLKYDCRVVLIDHLHFLVDMNTKQNMSLNIGAFMRRLKQEIAIGLNLAVIIIAHQGQIKDGQGPSINSIRDSSFVAQEADSIIIVSRRKNYDRVEIADLIGKYGSEKCEEIESGYVPGDDYSCGLAIVEISRTRRTGVFEFKKLFKKKGEFLVEI